MCACGFFSRSLVYLNLVLGRCHLVTMLKYPTSILAPLTRNNSWTPMNQWPCIFSLLFFYLYIRHPWKGILEHLSNRFCFSSLFLPLPPLSKKGYVYTFWTSWVQSLRAIWFIPVIVLVQVFLTRVKLWKPWLSSGEVWTFLPYWALQFNVRLLPERTSV